MFFELAEVLFVVQFTSWTNEDYSDAVHYRSLQFMPASRRVSTLAWRWVSARRGCKHPFRRVFLRLVFVNDASDRVLSREVSGVRH